MSRHGGYARSEGWHPARRAGPGKGGGGQIKVRTTMRCEPPHRALPPVLENQERWLALNSSSTIGFSTVLQEGIKIGDIVPGAGRR